MFRFSIREVMISTAVVSAGLAIVLVGQAVIADPDKYADKLGDDTAAYVMMGCLVGVLVLPIGCIAAAILIVVRMRSPTRFVIALVLFVLGFGSLLFCLALGRACAYQIV